MSVSKHGQGSHEPHQGTQHTQEGIPAQNPEAHHQKGMTKMTRSNIHKQKPKRGWEETEKILEDIVTEKFPKIIKEIEAQI